MRNITSPEFGSEQFADEIEDVLNKAQINQTAPGNNNHQISLKSVSKQLGLNLDGLLLLKGNLQHPKPSFHTLVKRAIFPYSDYTVNVWVYLSKQGNALIDCSSISDQVTQYLNTEGIRPKYLLTTHNHQDHVGGKKGVLEIFPNLSETMPEGMTKLSTPGHTKTHYSYYDKSEGICFCGDALFATSIGRPNYSYLSSIKSLNKLLSLPDDTILFPGHGPATTVAWEKKFNCFYSSHG